MYNFCGDLLLWPLLSVLNHITFFYPHHLYWPLLREWVGPNLVQGYKSLDIVTKKITFTESWFHVAKKGGYHNFHFHRDAPLAGIFYIQSGNCEIGNRWLNPFPGYLDKHSSKWCSQNFNTTFKPGQLILFPGWLLHSAVPHESDELRIVLAFNTAPE